MLNTYQKRKIKRNKPDLHALRVEEKGDIVRIYEHLTGNPVKAGGRGKSALCPFHGDRSSSFALYPETATYFCFTCQETGDSIDLIMKIRECDFIEAKELANSI